MTSIYVPRGEHRIAEQETDTLQAESLAAAVALILRCQKTGTVGLAHIPFPDSRIDPEQAALKPGLFADTAVAHFLLGFKDLGTPLSPETTRVILVGGAGIRQASDELDIGKKNSEAVQKKLRGLGLTIHTQDLGQNLNRTVLVCPAQEKISITAPMHHTWFL